MLSGHPICVLPSNGGVVCRNLCDLIQVHVPHRHGYPRTIRYKASTHVAVMWSLETLESVLEQTILYISKLYNRLVFG